MKQGKNKFILLLKNKDQAASINKLQQSLGKKFTSSAALGSDLKAQEVYQAGDGIVFKNLNVAVVEAADAERMRSVVKESGEVLYIEPERTYRSVNELDQIKGIRESLDFIAMQLDDLEAKLKEKDEALDSVAAPMVWGLKAIELKRATGRGKGIAVAVLDTGLFAAHPDFSGHSIKGKSFIPGEEWNNDGAGHGTHCTGIIAGKKSAQNGLLYGIAPAVDLLIGKVLGNNGNGSTSSIIDGIDWAIEKKARIINLSLGSPVKLGEAPSLVMERIGRKALAANCLIVAAAGNDSRRPNQMPRPVSNPANAESIMAVAAIDRNQRVANFSNAGLNASDGGRIDLAAPGVGIYSTYSDDAHNGGLYDNLSGTSMAAPHVAAVAALYLEKWPELSASELWLKLEKNARRLDRQKYRDVGNGLVQLY